MANMNAEVAQKGTLERKKALSKMIRSRGEERGRRHSCEGWVYRAPIGAESCNEYQVQGNYRGLRTSVPTTRPTEMPKK